MAFFSGVEHSTPGECYTIWKWVILHQEISTPKISALKDFFTLNFYTRKQKWCRNTWFGFGVEISWCKIPWKLGIFTSGKFYTRRILHQKKEVFFWQKKRKNGVEFSGVEVTTFFGVEFSWFFFLRFSS